MRQEAETQTPRQSSQNIIADLIAKKRGQLLRKSRRRDNSFQEDEDQVNKILRTAKRTLRSRDIDRMHVKLIENLTGMGTSKYQSNH